MRKFCLLIALLSIWIPQYVSSFEATSANKLSKEELIEFFDGKIRDVPVYFSKDTEIEFSFEITGDFIQGGNKEQKLTYRIADPFFLKWSPKDGLLFSEDGADWYDVEDCMEEEVKYQYNDAKIGLKYSLRFVRIHPES